MKENESIGRLISILHRWAQIYFQNRLGPMELGHGQFKMVVYLGRNEGATQQEICEYYQLDKGSTSFLIKKMVKSGFVRKEENPEDRRSHRLYLTEKALEKYKEIRTISQNWTETLLSGFSEKEKEQAFGTLYRMIENVDKMRKK